MFRTMLAITASVVFLPGHLLHSELADLLVSHPKLNFTSFATRYGHRVTEYQVVTEDGYILTLFRLPAKRRPPVLLTHGILDSADSWILRGEGSLAITLANNGYDVWCANSRGNRYSRRHISMDPDKDGDYWKFSFHEMGYYDLPAIIDLILEETHAPNLSAIGHSQGNTIFYVLASTRPEYNSKVKVLLALAPVAYIHHCPPPISIAVKLKPLLESLLTGLKINEFLGDSNTISKAMRLLCTTPGIGYVLCALGSVFPITGFDPAEVGPAFYPVVAAHYPAGTSANTIVHFLQIGYSRTFSQFDYGPEANLPVYYFTKPPLYDLMKVTMPVAFFTADNDNLSTLSDVELLRQQLPNIVYNLLNPRKQFNHLDYLVGKHMGTYLFPYILDVLIQYNGVERSDNVKQ